MHTTVCPLFERLQSRRGFLGRAGVVWAAGMLAGQGGRLPRLGAAEAASKAVVGSNIYGWSQYAQRDHKPLDVPGVISALRDAGYDYLENSMDRTDPENNVRFAEQLTRKGLKPVSLYTGARLHEAGKADDEVGHLLDTARVCRQAGFTVISCNPDPIGREKTEAELETQVKALVALGEGLNRLGMRLAVHHHLPEMASRGREFHYNFRHSRPDVVGFCYDVHWVWRGGIPPLDVLKAYGNRVVTWHLRQSRNGVWTEALEDGDIDFKAVAHYAQTHQLPRRFTVELALEHGTRITRSAAENHRLSREFVRRVFHV
ncbi:MAG: TIM barrel protein [Verrucomicrobia bacterium]|nr:TIM barrel protein [Verrucomicrobiota bacterium]